MKLQDTVHDTDLIYFEKCSRSHPERDRHAGERDLTIWGKSHLVCHPSRLPVSWALGPEACWLLSTRRQTEPQTLSGGIPARARTLLLLRLFWAATSAGRPGLFEGPLELSVRPTRRFVRFRPL